MWRFIFHRQARKKRQMQHRAVARFLTLKGLKAEEIETKLTRVHGHEALQISAVKKWRTHFLQGRTENREMTQDRQVPPILI
jgi:hypothetical protein